ncbi:PP2C family protein-serine/threonine phosphatase [Micromonospora auratinigra]|uniref:Serine phosphatase RsbU, regulator of sigma subunit n=1 Tax=Micromonospora auratinigra TaxID=261654 RepID=A0A1A8ZQY6_9ACTN|nr:PP2C family protein-serine/threonine phosphatase [Micromonospora auratinigra]SBT46535.1 Serine phosphatase RsbU, regulator of sigma subunit [Micromonospora auratinigra]
MTTARRGGLAGPVSGGGQASRPRTRRSTGAALPADSHLARELLDGLAEAVVTTDQAGVVTLVNAMAAELLPELVPGTELSGCPLPELAGAVRDGADTFDAEHRGRRLRGVRRALAGGRCAWYVRDVTEEQARTDALLVERSRTAFLAQAGSRLGLSLHREQTLRAAATLPVPYLADVAVVVNRPPPPAEDVPHWIRYAEDDPGPVAGVGDWGMVESVPGLIEALDGDVTDASPWLDAELAELTEVLPEGFGRPGTVLISPMVSAGGPAGALVLVRRPGRAGFDQREIELAREFAARAGAALAAAELYGEQAHLARVLQNSLLPPELPPVPGMTLAGGYRAAGDRLRIGGDFYDLFPTAQGALFALGDVCGKGVGAAVLTGRVRQSLQTLRLVEPRPLELMELLNRALLDAPDAARRAQFTTLLLGTLTREPDGGLLARVAGGGHPAPLVVRADGRIEPARVGGMPVGALAAARFGQAEVRLAPGDLLVAYTDGVTEARGGPTELEMFGEARLRQAMASGAGLPPRALVDRLLQLVDEWLDGQVHDDIAMLVVAPA